VFVLIGFAVWPRHHAIPVLIYHDVATSTRPSDAYTTELTLLNRELDYLKTEGYTPLSFSSAQMLSEQKRLPKKPVILTFDDALPGHMRALEALRAHGFAATFFIPSDLVGDSVHLSWRDVQALAAAGMEIGGHTANHAHVRELNAVGLENEIVGDKRHIEAEIGKPITVFAYPFQERTAESDAIVANAGYTIVRDTKEFRSTVLKNSFEIFLAALK
jgi:peptidoglycan/xylan/chitin deacetylase (PgdA/CDA1 family)